MYLIATARVDLARLYLALVDADIRHIFSTQSENFTAVLESCKIAAVTKKQVMSANLLEAVTVTRDFHIFCLQQGVPGSIHMQYWCLRMD